MSDPELDRTAQRVRDALGAHTDRVEVSPDAYARLAARVADSERTSGARFRDWLPTGRAVVAGVAALAVVAGGVSLLGGDDGDDNFASIENSLESTAPDSGSSSGGGSTPAEGSAGAVETPPVDGGLDNESDGAEGEASVDEGSEPAEAVGLGPIRASRLEAAEAFLALLDIGPTRAFDVDGAIVVRGSSEGEDSFTRDLATLELLAVGEGDAAGWTVAGASSPSITIAEPAPRAVVGAVPFVVSGEGSGFEGTVDITIRSATDGSSLLTSSSSAGNLGQAGPYDLTVEAVGSERGWVVVSSAGGADGVAESFAAVPITVNGQPDPSSYVVATVPLDDADQGLNVRARPGVGNEKVALVEWGSPLTRTPGAYPILVGDDVWWPVVTLDGTAGWVNARFLARAGTPSADELTTAAQAFLFAAAQPADIVGERQPVSERLGFTVVAEGETERLPADRFRDPAAWSARLGPLPSLADLLAAPGAVRDEVVITPGGTPFADRSLEDVEVRFFAELPRVSVAYLGTDGIARTVHLFVEDGAAGAVPVGAIVESGP